MTERVPEASVLTTNGPILLLLLLLLLLLILLLLLLLLECDDERYLHSLPVVVVVLDFYSFEEPPRQILCAVWQRRTMTPGGRV